MLCLCICVLIVAALAQTSNLRNLFRDYVGSSVIKSSYCLAEDLGSDPSAHIGQLTAVFNSSSRGSDTFFWLPQEPACTRYTYK